MSSSVIDGEAAGACPVCLRPDSGDAECRACRWVLEAGPWAGVVSLDDRRAFDDRLADARRTLDLRAVLAAAPADEVVLSRLAGFVRGGPAGRGEVERVRSTVTPLGGTDIDVPGAVAPALRRLVASTTGTVLALVDLAPDELRLAELVCDERGVPWLRGPVARRSWTELLPGLPADPDRARFVLAGGIGVGVDVEPVPDAAVRAAAAALPRGSNSAVVLLDRLPAWWPVVARVVRHVGRVDVEVRPGPRGRPLDAALVDDLLTYAPLRSGYGLVGVDVDPAGRTHMTVRSAFPAGAEAHSARPVHVPVTVPATRGRPLVLAVVEGGRPDGPPVVVTTGRMAPGPGQTVTLTLERPGRVAIAPADPPPAGRPDADLARLLAEVPATYRPTSYELDLAFAVEISGAQSAVRSRLDLVEETIQLIHDHHPERAAVRVAVVGYADHGSPQTVRTDGLVDTDAALRQVTGLTSSRSMGWAHAPVEDALRAVRTDRRLAWRRRGARRLVIVGSRRPHPLDRQSEYRCPLRINWRSELERLSHERIARVAVWDPPDWCAGHGHQAQATRREWAALGGDVRFPLAGTRGRELADSLDALPTGEPGPSLVFPIIESGPTRLWRREEP